MMQVKLWSEGYKCMKKGIFCRTKSVTMTPKSCARVRTTSLWEVTVKWPARAPKMKLILGLSNPQRYSCIGLNLSVSGRILKEYQNTVSAAELPELAIRTGKWAIFLTTDDHVPVSFLYCDESTEVSCLINVFFFVFFFTLPLDQTWLIHDRTSVKLNFTFFCVLQ